MEGILSTFLECVNECRYQPVKYKSVAVLLSVLMNRSQKLYWTSLITMYLFPVNKE